MKEWLSNLLGMLACVALAMFFVWAFASVLGTATVGVYRQSPARAWELYQESRDLEFKRHNEALGAK